MAEYAHRDRKKEGGEADGREIQNTFPRSCLNRADRVVRRVTSGLLRSRGNPSLQTFLCNSEVQNLMFVVHQFGIQVLKY